MAGARARAAYLGYRAAADAARVIPHALGQPLARATSLVYLASSPGKRRQVACNLDRVAAHGLDASSRRRAVLSVFDHYARYWHELFRISVEDPGRFVDHFECEGEQHLEAAAALGRGVLVALPHLGNWDVAGAWLASRGYAVTVVAEPAEPPELFDWFVATRERLGMRVVGLGPDAGSVLLRDLAAGRVVCLLCDRDLTGDGVEVKFFGETTRFPAGPAVLALRSGAPLLPAGTYFRGAGEHGAHILPPIPAGREGRLRDDVAHVTQTLADTFEDLIRAAPDQWLMLQAPWPGEAARRA